MQQVSSNATGTAGATAIMTDEQILGLEPQGGATDVGLPAGESATNPAGDEQSLLDARPGARSDSSGPQGGPRNDGAGNGDSAEPAWLRALDTQPEAAAEARRWRQAAQDAAALDADYFSAAPGAHAGLAARLLADDPAAFRSMLADAARVLAERDPQGLAELARQLGGASPAAPHGAAGKSVARAARNPLGPPAANDSMSALAVRRREDPSYGNAPTSGDDGVAQVFPSRSDRDGGPEALSSSSGAAAFPAEAYRAFEAAANDDVARQVRDSIDRTLTATLPDGIADGARRRIGEDIFRDLSATLSADRALSGQISELLRGWRFDASTRRQLTGLLTGRARTALPAVARRVVSEWTSSVLASDRVKQARIESAVSRRDITGGRLPEPVASSALRPRPVDYGRTSDEQILEM
jgi:hypothetical protein